MAALKSFTYGGKTAICIYSSCGSIVAAFNITFRIQIYIFSIIRFVLNKEMLYNLFSNDGHSHIYFIVFICEGDPNTLSFKVKKSY